MIALALAGAIAVFTLVRDGVDTDLLSMVGTGESTAGRELSALNALASDSVHVLCADAARAESLRMRYPFDEPMDPARFLDTVRTHGRGLLAPRSRELLERGEFERVKRSVKRRDFSGIGLFPKTDDPNYFLSDFATAFKGLQPKKLPEGAVMLTGKGSAIDAAVPGGGLIALVREARNDEGLWLGGSPFHTAIARADTIREINALGAISLLAVLGIGFLLFRSFRFVLPLAGAVACGLLAATGAVCLLPGRPHALTFLFGTTLVGLGVDYCYHALSRERAAPDFGRKLTGALATTCCSFAPLLFSGVCVLRQMSVFTLAGLVAVYLFVLLFTRPGAETASPVVVTGFCLPPIAKWAAFGAVLAAGMALRPSCSSDPSLFHRPAPVMARGEAKLAELSDGAAGLRLVDLTRWQEDNAALKARFGEEPKGEFLTAADLPSGMAFSQDGHDYLVLPESAAVAIVGGAGETVDLKSALHSLFSHFMVEALVLAGIALVLLATGTWWIFGRRAFAVILPAAGACALTMLTLGFVGEPITFFHVLSGFILVGLGLDYAIFHLAGDAKRDESGETVVFASFLTSLVGFGMLAFTSFPVTRGMGMTLAIGLCWAYVLSLPGKSAKGSDSGGNGSDAIGWHEQREQSAGKLRIMLMWYLYRVLGKTAAKLLFLPGYVFIYPFCRPARQALRQYYAVLGVKDRSFRHILGFAWSMLDKTDACTLCKDPPTFTLSGDTSWMRGGCFLLSTHLGCIEVLPAMAKSPLPALTAEAATPRVHAFQQLGHDAVFTEIFVRHLDKSRLSLHAVETIGIQTAVEMKSAVDRGEIVLMAGDRLAAGKAVAAVAGGRRRRAHEHGFLGRMCLWPDGVFRFAKLMECPVFAIVCVKTGWNRYDVKAKRLGEDLLGEYVAFLEENVRLHPYQWYQFYSFFDQHA